MYGYVFSHILITKDSSQTSPGLITDHHGLIADQSVTDKISHSNTFGSFVSQRLVSDDPTQVSNESMMISDESRTIQV